MKNGDVGHDVDARALARRLCLVSRRLNDPARSTSSESSLRRSIGTFALAASIVNVTIGAGIFRLPADMAAALGPTAPVPISSAPSRWASS